MSGWYEFTCPDCRTGFAVDERTREELLAVGCIRCGAAVDETAFQRRDDAPRGVA